MQAGTPDRGLGGDELEATGGARATAAAAVVGGRVRDGASTRGAPPERHDATPGSSSPNRNRPVRTNPPRWLHAAVVVVSLLPLLYVVGGVASDFFLGTRYFGSNPIKEAEHYSGKWALRFLALTLAVTPAIRLFASGWLVRYRRTFGLLAFTYACSHLVIYGVLDVELSWHDMIEDVAKRLYITIGMTALALMIPLAVTSTKGWIRRMGNRRWTALHRLVYASALLGLVHYWMSVKKDITEPALFGLVFATLLGWRAWRSVSGGSRAVVR